MGWWNQILRWFSRSLCVSLINSILYKLWLVILWWCNLSPHGWALERSSRCPAQRETARHIDQTRHAYDFDARAGGVSSPIKVHLIVILETRPVFLEVGVQKLAQGCTSTQLFQFHLCSTQPCANVIWSIVQPIRDGDNLRISTPFLYNAQQQ